MVQPGDVIGGALLHNGMILIGGRSYNLSSVSISKGLGGHEVVTIVATSTWVEPPSYSAPISREDFEHEVQWRVASEVEDRVTAYMEKVESIKRADEAAKDRLARRRR